MSGNGQVIAGLVMTNGSGSAVRWENLQTGVVKTLVAPGLTPSMFQGHDTPTSLSDDGSVVVFGSWNTGFASFDVWAMNANNGNALNLSAGFGVGPSYAAFDGVVSGDGRYIAWSQRRNVPGGCTSGAQCGEIWRYDLTTGSQALVSNNAAGNEGNRFDFSPQVSTDGRYLSWISTSTNLTDDATDGARHVFWKDLITGEARLVGDDRTPSLVHHHSISDNGRYVAWEAPVAPTWAVPTLLTSALVKDLATGSVVDLGANVSLGEVFAPHLSGDGRTVLFGSNGTGLDAAVSVPTMTTYVATLDADPVGGFTPQPAPTNAPGSLPTLLGDIPVVGDWDGNGTDSIGVFRNGVWLLRNVNAPGGVDITIPWGAPGDLPVVGDWDGDGTDSIGVFRNGVWLLRNANAPGGVDITIPWGSPDQVPVVGDWDGDGTDTIGVFRLGVWYLRNANTSGGIDATIRWGAATDVPVVGDWNGDHTDTIGVFRQGTWLLRDVNTSGPIDHTAPWGAFDDVPVPGDWNGDGTDGIGARRVGDWLVRNTPTPGGVDLAISWGGATFVGR